MAERTTDPKPDFETHPSRYRHLQLHIEGAVARLLLDVKEDEGLRPGYQLKLNSYDLSVDIELADAVQRLRFEHPEVSVVVVSSAQAGVFSAGANIFMLGTSSHAFKVNFCKFTNETRLCIEDATENSGQTYVAALNGIASGGGYELPLACKEIYLIDDRRSAVALPEVPYLGVLPGTGGITRVVDKRKVRRDRADVFITLAEGIKGKRAVEWGLVDAVYPSSRFEAEVATRAQALVKPARAVQGVTLEPLTPQVGESSIVYSQVSLSWGKELRMATLELRSPEVAGDAVAVAHAYLRLFRELDDALLRLRFHYPELGLIVVQTRGDQKKHVAMDALLAEHRSHWLVNETLHFVKRVLKRMDLTARSFFALVDEGSCFAGSFFELALSADRSYMASGASIALGALNQSLTMSNGWTRLQSRFYDASAPALQSYDSEAAEAAGLVTQVIDALDWDDEIRLATSERVSLSPDALTAMEANIRFCGPETVETKIFGRLSAWQNWIFQRPNAVGERGALKLYGRPERPEYDWNRT